MPIIEWPDHADHVLARICRSPTALNRFKPQPAAEILEAPPRLQLKEEPKADVARYDVLLKKLALAAIAAMPMLMAAVSHRVVEVPYGTP